MDGRIARHSGGLIRVLTGNGGPGQDLVCEGERFCKAQISDKKTTIGFNVIIRPTKALGIT